MDVYNEETLAFLAVNEAATRTYGFTRDEFLSMTVNDIRAREDIPTLIIKNSDPNEIVISSPWRHKTKDDKTIYVEMSSHPVVFDVPAGQGEVIIAGAGGALSYAIR